MSRLKFIGKALLLILFLGFLFFVVKYASTIRSAVIQYQSKQVAGAKTSFESAVTGDVKSYAHDAKEQIKNIKVSDVLSSLSGLKKVSQDIQSTKEIIINQVKDLVNKDKSK